MDTALTAQESAELAARAAGGDRLAFDRLVLAHRQGLVKFLCRYTHNLEEALDLAQDSFIKAWQALPRYRREAAFKTWIYQIALNTLRDNHRKTVRQPMSLTPVEDLPLEGRMESPEEASRRGWLAQQVQVRLAALTERQRQVVDLRLVGEHSFEEIAAMLGSPVGTIKATYFQSIQKVRNTMQEGGRAHVSA